MKHWILAGALIAGLMGGDLLPPGLMPVAEAASPGKPLLSGMKNENDIAVQQVRDALSAFSGANKHWPANLGELAVFAQQYRLPLDLSVFQTANYTVQNQGNASVAVFEFVMKSSPVKGAFALANYTVK
ncbi:hypothetical protein [Dongia sedimenti]|uniref:DUF3887 domain-containing protein n=1 Tax=Dongia sedimenti TaxID=3064282 RepID=A0ABU0YKY5_9PROT|nr:hypothetical protein [Rhodospirillaceae bacterium R-7]